MEADARVCYDRQVPCVVGNTVLLIIENPSRLEITWLGLCTTLVSSCEFRVMGIYDYYCIYGVDS